MMTLIYTPLYVVQWQLIACSDAVYLVLFDRFFTNIILVFEKF